MQKLSLANDWYVYARDDAFSLVTAIPENAVHKSVPYDALWHEGQRMDSVNGGRTGHFDGKVYYYQRELELDPAWADKRLLLKFEGIFSKSFVYVNGSQVGTGDIAYASLTCDITDYVTFDVPNTLLVVCKTELLSSRWYAGCGILRPVWLFVGELVHVSPDSLWVKTEAIDGNDARIRVRASVETAHSQVVDACLRISGTEGEVLCERFPLRVTAGGYELDRRFYLQNIEAWSEDSPALYDVALSLEENGEMLDTTRIRTGLRTLTWDPARGLRVNGESVLLRGGCLHHDEGILGGVSNPAFERWRVARLKEAGFNAIRSAHNHASSALLDACDELGVFVLDEVCDMWTKMKGFGDYAQFFPHSWREVTTSLVREDRTHPSVVGYSTGNEISDINTERGFEVAHELYQLIHALDDTRFVTNGVNGAFAAGEQVVDIAADLTGEPRQFGPWIFTDAVASWTWDVEAGTPMTVEVNAPAGTVELRLNGRKVATGQVNESYALFEVPYEPGTLEVVTAANKTCHLATADLATAHVAHKDVEVGGHLFSQLWIEDAAGTRVLDAGTEVDVTRDGWQLVAAGSAGTGVVDAFSSPIVHLRDQGTLAIYQR